MSTRRKGGKTDFAAAADRSKRTGTVTKAPAGRVRVKPVRITLDLEPDLYEDLQKLRREMAVDVDGNVTMAKLSRALYRLLLDDQAVQQDVRAALFDAAHHDR